MSNRHPDTPQIRQSRARQRRANHRPERQDHNPHLWAPRHEGHLRQEDHHERSVATISHHPPLTPPGLNHLSGLNITDIKILSGAKEILSDGSNMVATVHIPNPSVLTLDLGNVTMNLGVAGKPIGYALLPDLVLRPGNNTVPMQARVDQPTLLTLVLSTYKDGILPLEIVGNSSVKGDTHLTYYEEAVKANTIKLDLDAGPALKQLGINVTSAA
jgi:hypothetical protein